MVAQENSVFVRCIWMDESQRAIRIIQEQRGDSDVDIWIPKSQIHRMEECGKDAKGNRKIELRVPEWLAEKEGLVY